VLNKILDILYQKVFVNIVVHKFNTLVYIEVCSKDEIVESIEKTFDSVVLDKKMYEFINFYIKKSPYFYISILDKAKSQGAIPNCANDRITDFIDVNETNHVCYHDSWTYHTSKSELESLKKVYSKIGLDFIFSPFVILSNFFKDKIDSYMAMFILIEEDHISITMFDNSELLYGTYLELNHATDTEELIIDDDVDDLTMDDNIDLSDVDVLDDMDSLDEMDSLDDIDSLDEMDSLDDIDSLDDFGDIEDLDSFDDMSDFEDDKDVEEELIEELEISTSESPQKENTSFTGDYHIFLIIQRAVNAFYKDEKFNSQFIESVYIADALGVSGDLKKFLEEEMFLSVYIRQINLSIEVCNLAKLESK